MPAKSVHRLLGRILTGWAVRLVIGVLIVISAAVEIGGEIRGDGFDGIGSHHGVALLGLWHVLRAVMEIYESVLVVED